jgi:hypothetical protein
MVGGRRVERLTSLASGGGEMSGERRGLSPADQDKLGAAMAEVFAKAREVEEFEQLRRSLEAAEGT